MRNEEIIDPNDLADEVFVSMSTLKKDIRQIDKMLERFSLKVGISTKKGVHIIGSEANIRYCISEFVERFLELSLFYGLSSPLNSEMICIFPYF